MAAPGELEPGTVFADRYRVERKLSEGGMGAVYAVTQIGIERPRALKLMHPGLARDETLRSRFRQEALVGARIESDHVVQVHDAHVDEATRTPYLCMELLQGSDLEAFVGLNGRMSHDSVALVSRQLCHALARAHAAGVVHRDLKPANLFLAKTRHADAPFVLKVLDFGIAKCVAEAATRGRTTRLIGSPLWLRPNRPARNKRSVPPRTYGPTGSSCTTCWPAKPTGCPPGRSRRASRWSSPRFSCRTCRRRASELERRAARQPCRQVSTPGSPAARRAIPPSVSPPSPRRTMR